MTEAVVRRYRCMPHAVLSQGDFAIEAVQPRHIEAIRLWRNAQMEVLRQSAPITPEQQVAYYAAHVWPEMAGPRPRDLLVSFLHAGAPIGYGGLVHIAWDHRRAEVSFLMDPARIASAAVYARDFHAFLGLIKRLAFEDLGLERLFTETYDLRPGHVAVLEAAGFRREGVLRGHVQIDGRRVDCLLHGCNVSDDPQAFR
jgi:RimJ/RimL family protein N-acetyltransferase